MATSRGGRFPGRGHDDRAADTAPPAYTGVGAPRGYDPPPGAPGYGTGGYGPSGVPGTRPAASPHGPAPTTPAQYQEAVRRRRAADHQVAEFERFDVRLARQIHAATEAGRDDYVRELLSRQRSVRSRLEECELRRNRLLAREEEIGAGLPPDYRWPAG